MKKFSKLAAILAVCAFIFGGLLVSCSPHGTGYGLDDVQPSGGGSGGSGGGSGNPGDGGGSGGGGNPGGGDAGGGGGAPVAVTGITLNQTSATIGTGETLSLTYTITPENATDKSVSWISSAPDVAAVSSEGVVSALSAGSATITVTANGGTGIAATCNVTVPNYMIMPLTLEAITAGSICVFNPQNGMKYTLNGGEKTALLGTGSQNKAEISVQVGDKVSFYGSGTTITKYSDAYGNRTSISGGTAECKVYGNIMSLVDELGFATATQVNQEAFCELFRHYGKLIDAGNLILPATTLGNSCYMKMFQNCSKLTKAPALPATALADMCYSGMFNECLALKSAPALPATALADRCYMGMFERCLALESAPALPATALADRCYMGMFLGCAALEIAPVLSATTLVTGCYTSMFTMCSKLKSVTCLATTNIEHGNISQWLGDAGIEVTGTKTFYKASGVTAWTEEVGSDLAGWTITDYVAP